MMLDEGIDPSELLAAIGSPGKAKRTRSPAPRSIDILTKLESQNMVRSGRNAEADLKSDC